MFSACNINYGYVTQVLIDFFVLVLPLYVWHIPDRCCCFVVTISDWLVSVTVGFQPLSTNCPMMRNHGTVVRLWQPNPLGHKTTFNNCLSMWFLPIPFLVSISFPDAMSDRSIQIIINLCKLLNTSALDFYDLMNTSGDQ
jgi:hypothetical protein